MLNIGCHLSSSGGFLAMGRQAAELGANTFQFFTRNPRGGSARAIDPADAAALRDFMAANGFAPIIAHAPYTLNPAGKEARVRDFAELVLRDDLERMEYVPGNFYNLHPGSHVGQGAEAGIELTCGLLNRVMRPDMTTTVLLESMAGKGSELGGAFGELCEMLDRIDDKAHAGVLLDTCHIFDGGYDIVNDLDGVLGEFDRVVGLDRLKAVHLNDSMNARGSHKDRHQKLGEGSIGFDAFRRIINHPALRRLPFVLETPNELEGYHKEILMLRDAYEG